MEEYRKRAYRNYAAKMAKIGIMVKPEVKALIQYRAKQAGISMTEYIVRMCTR